MIKQYKQLLEDIQTAQGHPAWKEAKDKAEGFAIACQQELNYWKAIPTNVKVHEEVWTRIEELEAVVELAKKVGVIK